MEKCMCMRCMLLYVRCMKRRGIVVLTVMESQRKMERKKTRRKRKKSGTPTTDGWERRTKRETDNGECTHSAPIVHGEERQQRERKAHKKPGTCNVDYRRSSSSRGTPSAITHSLYNILQPRTGTTRTPDAAQEPARRMHDLRCTPHQRAVLLVIPLDRPLTAALQVCRRQRRTRRSRRRRLRRRCHGQHRRHFRCSGEWR